MKIPLFTYLLFIKENKSNRLWTFIYIIRSDSFECYLLNPINPPNKLKKMLTFVGTPLSFLKKHTFFIAENLKPIPVFVPLYSNTISVVHV